MNNESIHDGSQSAQPMDAGATSLVPFVLAGVIGIAMIYGGFKWWQVRQYESARAEGMLTSVPPLPLTDFTLDERGGEPFHSADMQGKVWVASYFFATCMGPCRTLNGNIQELSSYPDLNDVTWVSITCDPDNDSLDVLKQYANQFQADSKRWLFCRSDLDYLKRVARGMNLALFIKTHSDHLVVVDRAGTIRGMFDGTSKHECQQLRVLLHECLDEKPPAAAAEDTTPTAQSAPAASLPLADPSLDCCEDDPTQPAIRSGT